MNSIDAKRNSLRTAIDWSRPELAQMRDKPDALADFVRYLANSPRSRFRFEPNRKAAILDFLKTNYPAWRRFDTATADSIAGMSIEDAKKPRALRDIAALGQAWWATGDESYGAAFENFYHAPPTGDMFNWSSFNGMQGAIELSAYSLLQDCPGFSIDGRIAFLDHLQAITANAWDVHTSQWTLGMLGPEGHNWYLHGMHVLPFLGLLFPEFKRSDFFLQTGWSVVEEHMRGHYKADGGARETTLGYQAGSIHGLWDLYLIAHRNGYPISPGFADRLLQDTLFLLRLMSPQGGLPSFGDGGHKPGNLTSIAAMAAALTGNGECKWYAEYCRRFQDTQGDAKAGILPLCVFWDVGLTGADTYAATRAQNPKHRSVLMGPTGYAALRNGDADGSAYAAIAAADRGPIVTSHGHNDIFAVEIHADGVRFTGEMGCAPYGKSRGREYDQTTQAHNCFAVDNMEQVDIADEWRWNSTVIPCVRRWISETSHDFFHGVHEGYYSYPQQPILHARKVLFLKGNHPCWLIFDWLAAEANHNCSAYFHGCVPGEIVNNTIALTAENGSRLWISTPADSACTATLVEDEGLDAYRKERSLDAESTPCFAFHGEATGSSCFVWVLTPASADGAQPQIRSLPVRLNSESATSGDAVAVEIIHEKCVDTVCLSHKEWDAHLEFGNEQMFGLLAIRRRDAHGNVLLSVDHQVRDGSVGR